MAHRPALLAAEDPAAIDRLVINTIKTLAIDAVQKANSGHPGTPMGLAEYGYVLWTRFLKHDPTAPDWPDRDRFVLSAGHASMLLYALLHLAGYGLRIEDLKQFRQLKSRTPGHPEHGVTPGVEATTGPLGQGVANGVGMAIAERMLAERFNTDGHTIIDHFTYGILSDGDIMEGVQAEAASIAGHLGLGRLIYFYDDNRITIDGSTELTLSENVGLRFEGYGWHVQRIDGHDQGAIGRAIEAARAETARPSLIIGRTHIAHGSPNKQDTAEAHGAPLGEEEVRLTKLNIGWPPDAQVRSPRGGDAGVRRAARGLAGGAPGLGRPLRRLRRRASGARPRVRAPPRRGAAGGLDGGLATLRPRREAPGHPLRIASGDAGPREAGAGARGRLGRPRELEQDDARRRGLGWRASNSAAATCTSGCGSTRWAAS